MSSRIGQVVSAAIAAYVARRTYSWIAEGPSAQRWSRVNHRGEAVTLAEGPAVAAGTVAGLLISPRRPRSVKPAAVMGVVTASALGALDDLTGATDIKGLRGHLTELRQGRVTTGAVKLFGLGAAGIAAGTWARRGRGGLIDSVLAGGVVAGSANLANLFDLRPGRAAKVFLAASAGPVLLGASNFGSVLAAPTGAMAAVLREDLAERSMLGDTGANALGAAWGVGAASSMDRKALAVTLTGLVAATALSERVSFSSIIERMPPLRLVDGLGRRTAP